MLPVIYLNIIKIQSKKTKITIKKHKSNMLSTVIKLL